MKKIIFGITGLTLGGAERVLVDISNRLVEKYEVTIFTLYPNGELEKELDKKVHRISLYNFRYDEVHGIKKKMIPLQVLLNKRKIYKKYIDNENYVAQIAFLEGPIARIFSVKSRNKTNKIAWLHNDISKVFGKGPKARLKRIIDRNIYEKYDTLIFVSRDNMEKFNKTYYDMDLPNEKVINNYINSERILNLAEKEKVEIFSKNEVNLVQVSRLVEQKGIERLINVHSELVKQGYKHKIFIIGNGPLKGKLEKLIKEKNVQASFKLLGAKENPYPYIKRADYFCLFSKFEGYPMVIEEAKILKKYILATNTATREVLVDYKDFKQVVDNNEEGIKKAIKFAIENKNKLEAQENKYIYDNEKVINKIVEVIEENKKHPNRTKKLETKQITTEEEKNENINSNSNI